MSSRKSLLPIIFLISNSSHICNIIGFLYVTDQGVLMSARKYMYFIIKELDSLKMDLWTSFFDSFIEISLLYIWLYGMLKDKYVLSIIMIIWVNLQYIDKISAVVDNWLKEINFGKEKVGLFLELDVGS